MEIEFLLTVAVIFALVFSWDMIAPSIPKRDTSRYHAFLVQSRKLGVNRLHCARMREELMERGFNNPPDFGEGMDPNDVEARLMAMMEETLSSPGQTRAIARDKSFFVANNPIWPREADGDDI